MARSYPLSDLPANARRYLTARGEYPYVCRVRTPSGTIAPTLYSSHDILTVNEIFCRGDYRYGPDLRVAVDVGANIGISALYFLTRNSGARVYAFEPDPRRGLMPPFLKADEEGLDTILERLESALQRHGERFAPPVILRRLVAQGRLGQRTGQGFLRLRPAGLGAARRGGQARDSPRRGRHRVACKWADQLEHAFADLGLSPEAS
jgi:hypothetical protein